MLKVYVLNENTAGKRGFLAEHGLSLLIETDEKRYLFDTGQSGVFLKNADQMGVSLENLDGIILSHGHFDHCGGLEYLLERYREKNLSCPPVYVRDGAFLKKTAVNPDKITYRTIGIPWEKQLIERSMYLTKEKEQIAEHIWVLGKIPYTSEFEKRPEIFFIDRGEDKIPDYMEDEQMLVVETEKGLCVFAGCCHAGVINCLSYVKQSFPGKRIYSLFAGMHLTGCRKERLEQTVSALSEMKIPLLMPVHCTGLEAIGRIKGAFGDGCRLVETGAILELESL